LAALPPGNQGEDVPWHRVVNARGTVSHRGELSRARLQEALLRAEGVAIDELGRFELAAHRFDYPGVTVPYTGAE
jgi:methylated-DNA-protein-cysteine methyltransferase-like protein